MKPICVKCERFYRPKKNSAPFVEMMPKGGMNAKPGTSNREAWKPYKLWLADLWVCHGCGHELIVGAGREPIAEHYQPTFDADMTAWKPKIIVNDC